MMLAPLYRASLDTNEEDFPSPCPHISPLSKFSPLRKSNAFVIQFFSSSAFILCFPLRYSIKLEILAEKSSDSMDGE